MADTTFIFGFIYNFLALLAEPDAKDDEPHRHNRELYRLCGRQEKEQERGEKAGAAQLRQLFREYTSGHRNGKGVPKQCRPKVQKDFKKGLLREAQKERVGPEVDEGHTLKKEKRSRDCKSTPEDKKKYGRRHRKRY